MRLALRSIRQFMRKVISCAVDECFVNAFDQLFALARLWEWKVPLARVVEISTIPIARICYGFGWPAVQGWQHGFCTGVNFMIYARKLRMSGHAEDQSRVQPHKNDAMFSMLCRREAV